MFSDFVLHGSEGFVESVDDEVAGAGAACFLEGCEIVLDAETDCAGDVGGEREGRSSWVQAAGNDECAAPVLTEGVEQGEDA